MLIIVAVLVNLTMPNTSVTTHGSAPAVPRPSEDAAGHAAEIILAQVALPEARQPTNQMREALAAANESLGTTVFARANSVGRQELVVSVNSGDWNRLTDADRNALSASISSTWATLWQRSHPHGALEEGTIVRLVDQQGNEIRRDTFRRP